MTDQQQIDRSIWVEGARQILSHTLPGHTIEHSYLASRGRHILIVVPEFAWADPSEVKLLVGAASTTAAYKELTALLLAEEDYDLGTPEVARYLGIHTSTVRHARANGRIRAKQEGAGTRPHRFTPSEVWELAKDYI